jgi:biopolymer transport protein ExbD
MAREVQREEGAAIFNINVTPLVDITLVLLIIMMVTAKLIVSQSLPMDVPGGKTPDALPQMFTVELKRDGGIRVANRDIPGDAALIRAAREAKTNQADIRAVITAEKKAPHGKVIRVLDLLKQAGIERVAFAKPVESFDTL